jgi:hypothetical protein
MKKEVVVTIDDKVKIADVAFKKAQIKDISDKLKLETDRMLSDRQKIDLDKIVQIGNLLESFTVESKEGHDIVKYTPTFDEEEIKRLKLKLFQLLRKI